MTHEHEDLLVLFYIYAFSRCFYPKLSNPNSGYTCFSTFSSIERCKCGIGFVLKKSDAHLVTTWMGHTRMGIGKASLINNWRQNKKGSAKLKVHWSSTNWGIANPHLSLGGWTMGGRRQKHARDPTGAWRNKQRACNLETRQWPLGWSDVS